MNIQLSIQNDIVLRLGAACNNLFFVSHKVGGILLMEDAMIPLILTVLQLPNVQNTQVATYRGLNNQATLSCQSNISSQIKL